MLQWFFAYIISFLLNAVSLDKSYVRIYLFFIILVLQRRNQSVSLFSANLVGNGIAILHWGSKTQGFFGIELIFHFFVDSTSKYAQYFFKVRRVLPLSIHMNNQTDDNGLGASSFATEIEGENIISLVVLFSSLLHLRHF